MLILETLQRYLVEITLGVLLLLTVFRRELSSNNSHGRRNSLAEAPLSKVTSQLVSELTSESISVASKQLHLPSLPSFSNFAAPNLPSISSISSDNIKDSPASFLNLQIPIFAIPLEVFAIVMSYVPIQTILETSPACKLFNESAKSDQVWKLAFFSVYFDQVVKQLLKGDSKMIAKCDKAGKEQGWKKFFFEFSASWLPFTLLGHCTEQSCFVGLHGAIYDITSFLEEHPGSPETLLLNSGCDATRFFEDIGHSVLARAFAAKFRVCEVCPLGPGVLPVPKHHSKPAKPSSRIILSSTFWRLEAGRKDKEAEVKRGGGGVTMGESAFCYKDNHIFFDPLERVWKYWQYDYIKEEGMVYM